MNKIVGVVLLLVFISSCRSEFETIRTSNDPERIFAKAEEYFDKEEYYKAQDLYKLVIPYFRGKEKAETLFYKYAYTYYNNGEYILSSHYFKSFANTFYNSSKREEMDFMSAYSHYLMSPNSKLDQTYTGKAIESFQTFANSYPNSTRISEINKLIDEMRAKLEKKSFDQAHLYFKLKQYKAAVQSFDNMLKDYPGSSKSEEARYLKMKAAYTLAENSIYDKKEERYDETMEYYAEFIKRHPNSKWKKDASTIRKNTIKELKKFGRV